MSPTPLGAVAAVAMLHRFLTIGMLTLLAATAFLWTRGVLPLIQAGEVTVTIGRSMAGFGIVLIALALFVLRRRVPPRRAGQAEDAFWVTAVIPANLVWFVLEGAGMLGIVGAMLTAEPMCAIVAAGAIGAMMLTRPATMSAARF